MKKSYRVLVAVVFDHRSRAIIAHAVNDQCLPRDSVELLSEQRFQEFIDMPLFVTARNHNAHINGSRCSSFHRCLRIRATSSAVSTAVTRRALWSPQDL